MPAKPRRIRRLLQRVRPRPAARLLAALAGLALIVALIVLLIGERALRQEAERDLARARALAAIAQQDRTDALLRARDAGAVAAKLSDRSTDLAAAAGTLEAALGDALALQDQATAALNDAAAALATGNASTANASIAKLNGLVAQQQNKLKEVRTLLDDFDRKRARLESP